MRRTAALGRGCTLLGRGSAPITNTWSFVGRTALASSSRPLSTSADDLLNLFKQAASQRSSAPAAPAPTATAAYARPTRPAGSTGGAGRGRTSASTSSSGPGNWAKQLANQLEERAPSADAAASAASHPAAQPQWKGRDNKKSKAENRVRNFRPARHAMDSYVRMAGPRAGGGPGAGVDMDEGDAFGSRDGGQDEDSFDFGVERFDDASDEFDRDDGDDLRLNRRDDKEDERDVSSLTSAMDEGGDDDWESMATEVNAWGTKLFTLFRPYYDVMNKHTKTRRMRRQKYCLFLERCIARRKAKKSGKAKPAVWQWPKERDLIYNTDLFVPLNLELKGIEEEGEDLHGLLTEQMEAAARAIGHNASWPLEEKRKLMMGLKQFYERAVRKGPASYDIFADHRHALDDDFIAGGSSNSD